mmetsp:Transcript_7683/g.20471  ORF Transcript_7683/g.20471 Transcript_7683/m.20471 type:complete len:235 (+) Transcript_7683:672-1376(+)
MLADVPAPEAAAAAAAAEEDGPSQPAPADGAAPAEVAAWALREAFLLVITSHSLLGGGAVGGGAGRGGGGLEATTAATDSAGCCCCCWLALLLEGVVVGGWERSTRNALRTPPARVDEAPLYAASRVNMTLAVLSLVQFRVYSPAQSRRNILGLAPGCTSTSRRIHVLGGWPCCASARACSSSGVRAAAAAHSGFWGSPVLGVFSSWTARFGSCPVLMVASPYASASSCASARC